MEETWDIASYDATSSGEGLAMIMGCLETVACPNETSLRFPPCFLEKEETASVSTVQSNVCLCPLKTLVPGSCPSLIDLRRNSGQLPTLKTDQPRVTSTYVMH
jgi:hypothetical protein